METPGQEPSSQSSSSALKKVFSRSSRGQTENADQDSLSSSRSRRRLSVDSTPEKSRSKSMTELIPEDNVKGISKLLVNRRKKKRGAANSASSQLSVEDREADELHSPSSVHGSVNLLTSDSEPEQPPPLISRDSHAGYLTASSPLITTITADRQDEVLDSSPLHSDPPSLEEPFPSLGRSDTPSINGKSKKGDSSPSRQLKDAFIPSPKQKSPSSSPERGSPVRPRRRSFLADVRRKSSLSEKRATKHAESNPPPLPDIKVYTASDGPDDANTSLGRSATSPPATSVPLMTTVTPPTPTDTRPILPSGAEVMESPESIRSSDLLDKKKVPGSLPQGTVVSPSGNMISHRRVRSASAASHAPSKLSQATTLSPMTEEPRTPAGSRASSGAQTGFFSSVFTAAQNAASSISNTLTAPPKNKSVALQVESEKQSRTSLAESTDADRMDSGAQSLQASVDQKELAVNTLGSGDLDFSHLDIDSATNGVVTTKDGVVITKPDTSKDPRKSSAIAQRDEMAAKIEDQRAARAVSMAYEKPADRPSTPSVLDDAVDSPAGAPLTKETSAEQTTPSGSVVEGEPGSGIRRTGSVRSRLASRRHRGSSGATGSTIGAIGGAMALGLPGGNSSVPRLTGFAVASKKRNRDFHQLFRSVPDDDFLIEDYSCALQREIILAGRIYISEGHICFSSNILGWVTTLVISFDEIVAIEKENTAMVFPNAIAIQTLHARHTFRSLLSREATYDLMVNIWKTNHPSLKSTVNGTRIVNGTGDKTEKGEGSIVGSNESDDDDDDVYDEDEDGDGTGSQLDAEESVVGSEPSETAKALSRQVTTLASTGPNIAALSSALASMVESPGGDKGAGGDAGAGFPGPATHPPTEFTDPSGRYDKIIKDEVLPAPLGRVYNLVFGPASGAFMTKFLIEDEKSQELQFEDDKKGLNIENKTRQYSYIKPLGGSIGPKQTKCISTETLDFLDLEKAVLVTLTTQTPDVPSGNVFSTKTKYLFTWAPGNQTRFFMSCAIEWTGKSWLKGPIEKGAVDGQNTYGNNLIKALKIAVAPKGRVVAAGKNGKAGKARRKKGDVSAADASGTVAIAAASDSKKGDARSWGVFEPLHGPLGPVVSLIRPLWNAQVAIAVIGFLLFSLYSREPVTSSGISFGGYPGISGAQRVAAYEELWQHEESELWRWLENRVGLDGVNFPVVDRSPEGLARQRLRRQKDRGRDLDLKLKDERMSEREMDQALKTTRERLEVLEQIMSKRKSQT